MGELGEPGVGRRTDGRRSRGDVRLLQVVQFFQGADKGGDRELLAGQQFESLERNQCRNPRHAPAGGGLENPVDLVELGDPLVGQAELFDAVEVFLTGAAFDHLQLQE